MIMILLLLRNKGLPALLFRSLARRLSLVPNLVLLKLTLHYCQADWNRVQINHDSKTDKLQGKPLEYNMDSFLNVDMMKHENAVALNQTGLIWRRLTGTKARRKKQAGVSKSTTYHRTIRGASYQEAHHQLHPLHCATMMRP